MTIYEPIGYPRSEHFAQGGSNIFHIKERAGIATLSRIQVNSPVPPKPPRGLFNLAIDQDAMVQDPVWTAVIS